MRIGPTNAQAHYLMALSMTETNQPFDAEYHYSRALELSRRRDPSLLANYALCLRKQGRLGDARPLYREALQKSPGAIQILMGLAQLEEADGQLDAALALLDEVAGLAPELPGPLLLICWIAWPREPQSLAVATCLKWAGCWMASAGFPRPSTHFEPASSS